LQTCFVNLLNPPRLDKNAVKNSFNRGARDYDRCAVLQHEVQSRLLERLEYVKVKPERVLDLGCGTGKALKPLAKLYRGAQVIALDMAHAMLQQARGQYRMLDRKLLVNADMEALPFADASIDLVFSSLALQWSNDLFATLGEFKRIGRSGGLLMFSTMGVDTLSELREASLQIDSRPRVHQFVDMHEVGDMMLAQGLSQPVLDTEKIVLEYREFKDLLKDLKAIGATNAERTRKRGLMTARRLQALREAYESIAYRDGRYLATYEIVYGHAWFA
jgi:malonyl-CoA O-methyltransferase